MEKNINTENENMLNAIFKTTSMATYNMDNIKPEIKDKGLINLIQKQNQIYSKFSHEVQTLARKNKIDLKPLPMMAKAGSYMGIKMNTLFNDEVSHLADMLYKGTNMGIEELETSKKENPKASKSAVLLLDELNHNLYVFAESLKHFIKTE